MTTKARCVYMHTLTHVLEHLMRCSSTCVSVCMYTHLAFVVIALEIICYQISQEELLSIRMRFGTGDVVDHLSRKLAKCRAKRVSLLVCVCMCMYV